MNQEPEPLEETDAEETELLVVDPEDYNRTQRLKEIHRARENVLDTVSNAPGRATSTKHHEHDYQVGKAVSMYVLELEPLIRKAIDAGALDEDLITFPAERKSGETEFDTIFDFAFCFGKTEKGDPHRALSMMVFRHANRIMMELGLELELDADESDEWEV